MQEEKNVADVFDSVRGKIISHNKSPEFNAQICEKIEGKFSAISNAATFSVVDVDVVILKSSDKATEVMVNLFIIPTDEKYSFPIKRFLTMDSNLKQLIDKYGLLEETDFNNLRNKVRLLVETRPNIEKVDALPILEYDESAIDVANSLYGMLMEDIENGDEKVTDSKEKFVEKTSLYAGLYQNDFRNSHHSVILFSTEELSRILNLSTQKLSDIIKTWHNLGLIWTSDAASMAGRLQVKCRLGVENRMWYAVVTPADFKL